ncbi:MAG: TraB/VirB10 family protein [Gammaproteobacteria bacterium]
MTDTHDAASTTSTAARKRQTIVTISAAGLLFGGILLGLYLTDPQQQIATNNDQVSSEEEITEHFNLPGKKVDPREVWISRGESDINTLKKSNVEFMRTIEQLRGEISQLQTHQARANQATPSVPVNTGVATFPTLPPPPPPRKQSPASGTMVDTVLSNVAGQTANNLGVNRDGSAISSPAILSVSLADNAVPDDKDKQGTKKKPKCNITNCIPPGAFAKAALLSGLDAPTGGRADTNPHPVLLELLDTASLPNRYRSRVKECRVVAAGFGRISDERAYLRLERLSCVLRGGEILDVPLKGYVAGEDGKVGMRGHLISKQGALIARALLAGTAGGIGSAISQSYSSVLTSPTGAVSTIDPSKTLEFGVASGFGTALEKISDWYLKRADETYPIIEIDAGRMVEIVLTEGVALGVNLENEHS